MGHKVTTTWKNKMLLESDNPLGKNLLMESGPDFGGSNQGLSPKALMLSSLGGCTGLDLLSLLKKMRVEIEGFKVIVNGELTEEHPKYYDKVSIDYYFIGTDLNKENIKKAVSLSEERYCGVIKMFRAFAEVTIAIHFNE
ncbi:OsmC family protein [Flavobacteriaceae bacterium]|jgi:putative redox protein|nr:OsmC/Ohr family protein [uncultured bacterium]MDA9341728.1 OsmC family protein [Flavobacteriaceae bacterium]MDB9913998.1 OsmC family protein [Flavobacteriaceae bacterium]MDB9994220.1 OsmC family protein [Flavobacteriaceae bacterium]|tara:strand:- start:666 stop:1085 length:420 start_codon:yes stop_codon:yes gene_type:complete